MGAVAAAIAGAVIAGGASVASSQMAGAAAADAADATAAAKLKSQKAIVAIADEQADVGDKLVTRLLNKTQKYLNAYETQTTSLVGQLKFTPIGDLFQADANGNSISSKILDYYHTQDDARKRRILGDAEPALKAALKSFSALASGDTSEFSAQLRSSDAAIAANTRGGPIGLFANLSAANRFNFQKEGVVAASSLVNTFSSLDTATPTIFQSAIQLADERRREADRVDKFNSDVVTTKLNLAQNLLNSRLGAQAGYVNSRLSILSNNATTKVNAANGAYNGSGSVGLSQLAASQGVAAAGAAASQGISQYQTNKNQKDTIDAIKNQPRATGATTTSK